MWSLLVDVGRLKVVLVLLGTIPALVSAQPIPMDENEIDAVVNELLENGLGGLASRYNQLNKAPASAPHVSQAANPNVYHPPSQFSDASGMQAQLQQYTPDWGTVLHPADPATTIHATGTTAYARVRQDHQYPYASGFLEHHAAYSGSQPSLAGSSRALEQMGSSSGSQPATPLEPGRARTTKQAEIQDLFQYRGANFVFERPQGRDSADRDYLVGPSYNYIPRISEYGLQHVDASSRPGTGHLQRYISTQIFQPARRFKGGSSVIKANVAERRFVQEKFARDMALAVPGRPTMHDSEVPDVLMKWYDVPADDLSSNAFDRIGRAARAVATSGQGSNALGPFTPYYINDHLIAFTSVVKGIGSSPVYGRIMPFRVTAVPDPVRNSEVKLKTLHLGYVLVNRVPNDFKGLGPLPPWNLP